jgi:N-acetylmuramoyl-L-alanine amidase
MILSYLIKVILISGVLYGYYFLFLRNKRHHQYNRFYLLGMAITAVILPLLHIPIDRLINLNDGNRAITLLKVSTGSWEEPVAISPGNDLSQYFGVKNLMVLVYAAGAVFLLLSFVKSLVYIKKITRSYPFENIKGIRVFQTEEPGTPFSFFSKIFWNSKLDLQTPGGEQVFRHELYHVRNQHSFDIVLLEALAILFWFNPFIHLFKKEIKAIHEFMADQYAVSDQDHYGYAEFLVQATLRAHQVAIVHPFFQSQIKRRIIMLTQFRSRRHNYLSRVMILPLLLILFCAFATRINLKAYTPASGKPVTIVIDAGHGGIDPGAQSTGGVLEKDIALSLARKIKQLAREYNVNVIMTREKDELPGGGRNIQEALRYRANLVEQSKADLFLSIHVMADPANQAANGFDMYIPGDGSAVHRKSVAFGSALSASVKKDYQVAPDLRQRETPGIWVLRAAAVPSVLVECGYITNEKDLAFISSDQNQEKIARDLLEGIVQYSQTNTSVNSERESAPINGKRQPIAIKFF